MIQIELTKEEQRALTAHLDGRRTWARLLHHSADRDLLRSDLDSAIKKVTGREKTGFSGFVVRPEGRQGV